MSGSSHHGGDGGGGCGSVVNPDGTRVFERMYDVEDIRSKLVGREAKTISVLCDRFGVGLQWVDSNERLHIKAWSEANELLQALDEQMLELNERPQNVLDSLIPLYRGSVEITSCADTIIGAGGTVIKWLQREIGVDIKTFRQGGRAYLEADSYDEDLINLFDSRIRQIIANPAPFATQLKQMQQKKIHIFMDVSNIMLGSKRDPLTGMDDINSRLDARNLLDTVVGLRHTVRKIVVGSSPPPRDSPIWDRWRDAGWDDIRILDRVTRADGRSAEQAVDECLHAQMSADIMQRFPEERTLVLMTGDGNRNEGYTSFPKIIELALRSGKWQIELWSWGSSTAHIYDRFRKAYPTHFKLQMLDQHRRHIVYRVTRDPSRMPPNHQQQQQQQQQQPYQNHHQHQPPNNSNQGALAFTNASAGFKNGVNPNHPGKNHYGYNNYNNNSSSSNSSSSSNNNNSSSNNNSNAPHGGGGKQDGFEAVASDETAAQRLYDFIRTRAGAQGCITAFDVSDFYAQHPECRHAVSFRGVAAFCQSPCAMGLLRWEHGRHLPGNGLIHALPQPQKPAASSPSLTPTQAAPASLQHARRISLPFATGASTSVAPADGSLGPPPLHPFPAPPALMTFSPAPSPSGGTPGFGFGFMGSVFAPDSAQAAAPAQPDGYASQPPASPSARSFHESVALRMHAFIVRRAPDLLCVPKAVLDDFYAEHPDCEHLVTELCVSAFCSQPYARNLLRWEYDKAAPGGGHVHAITAAGPTAAAGMPELTPVVAGVGGSAAAPSAPPVRQRPSGPASVFGPIDTPAPVSSASPSASGLARPPPSASAPAPTNGSYSSNINLLTCPISLEVMRDPVITPNGETFERAAILSWLEKEGTCPMTRAPLRADELRDNRAIKYLCDDYRQKLMQQQERERVEQQLEQLELMKVTQQINELLHLNSHDGGAASFGGSGAGDDDGDDSDVDLDDDDADYQVQALQLGGIGLGAVSSSLISPPPVGVAAQPEHRPASLVEAESRLMQSLRQQGQWLQQQQQQPQQQQSGSLPSAGAAVAAAPRPAQEISYRSIAADNSHTSWNASQGVTNNQQEQQHHHHHQQQQASNHSSHHEYYPPQQPSQPQTQNRTFLSSPAALSAGAFAAAVSGSGLVHGTETAVGTAGADMASESELCVHGPSCTDSHCPLLHWPTSLCRNDGNGGSPACRLLPTAQCPFLHISQMNFIVVNASHKRIGVLRAGFATVPNGGKKMPTMVGATSGATGASAGGSASTPKAAPAPAPLSADYLPFSDLCTFGMACRGGCGRLHWPNRQCMDDPRCPRYGITCSYLHAKQRKYMLTNPDGSLRAVKKIGFKTIPNEGKK